jgi:hypothetical protein
MVYLPPKHGLSFRGFAKVKVVRLNLTAYWLEGTPIQSELSQKVMLNRSVKGRH